MIDASGTWHNPNPLGATGLPALGEAAVGDRLAYGMPDILGKERARYAGKRVAVVGAGYSAINVLLDLTQLGAEAGADVPDGEGSETGGDAVDGLGLGGQFLDVTPGGVERRHSLCHRAR